MEGKDAFILFGACLARGASEDWLAFVDLYEARVRSLVWAAIRHCGAELSQPDVDELVQELYFRLLKMGHRRFDPQSDEELWRFVGRVALNLVIDLQRSSSARKRRPPRQRRPERTRGGMDPERRLLAKERREMFLKKCLEVVRRGRVMSELQVLVMALLEGWSSREITTVVEGFTTRQVDSLVQRLRRHLAKEGIRLPRRVCVGATTIR